ncbi:MAG: hypothetical protein KatS3mg105_1624 [Gemmatales bacterium]|nr:MAG: hypothetical protein KatS3mg105_1624 [Gemmatales bacterium]
MKTTIRLLRPAARLLVVETDIFHLRAAIVHRRKDHAVVEKVAQARSADFGEALAEIRSSFASVKMPKRAILLSPEVLPAILELPVDPAKPRPAAQMQELIRWEMESYLAQHAMTRRIGDIAIGRGYLTADQVRTVLQHIERRKRDSMIRGPGDRRGLARFGEVAVELELLTRPQVEECLAIQERLQVPEEDHVYCWMPVTEAASPSGQFRWLVSCVNRSVRESWADVFRQQRLHLQGIYPLIGNAAAALPDDACQRSASILEVQAGVIGASQVQGGCLTAQQVYYTSGRSATLETYLDLLGTDSTGPVYLAGRHANLPAVGKELRSLLQREVSTIPLNVDDATANAESLAGIVGAARHAFGLVEKRSAPALPVQDPPPPLWQQPRMRWLAAAAALAFCMLVGEWFLARWKKAITADHPVLAQLDARVRQNQQIANLAKKGKNAEELLAKAKKELADKRRLRAALENEVIRRLVAERDRLRQLRHTLENRLARRTQFVSDVLQALGRATTDEVVINNIKDSGNDELHIQAWSLSEAAGQQFAERFADRLQPWHLVITDVQIRSQRGRLGLEGFGIDLKLGYRPGDRSRLTTAEKK